MKYIICDRILFVPDLNTLSLTDNCEKAVSISNPVRRLLELLIVRQGQNVAREEIFRKVWDDFGMVSSNNNLNHCISKLRRVLRGFDIEDDVIVTIPRLGFMLHKDVAVRIIDENVVEPTGVTAVSATPDCAPRWRDPVRWQLFSRQVIFLLGAALLLLLGLFIVQLHLYPRTHAETYLGKIESCKVYLRNESLTENEPVMMQSMRRYLSQRPVSCEEGEYLLVYSQDLQMNRRGDAMRLHITRCSLHRANKLTLCSEW